MIAQGIVQLFFSVGMMWLCSLAVVFPILLAGGVNIEIMRDAVLDEGTSFSVSVLTMSHTVTTCYLETPQDGTIDFIPGDQSRTTEKYHIDPGTAGITECALTINNIDENDEGIWVMSYDHENGTGRTQNYNLTVNLVERQESTESEEELVNLLSQIYHFTSQESLIDISLNKESFEEECYVRPPNGEMTRAELLTLEGVTVQNSSDFVSCRVTIRPKTEDLLGEWRLCGKSIEKDEMRCQPTNITWNNNNADARWDSLVQTRFSHPVNFGGRVNPGVAGRGDVITCHVITPNGEDLVLKSDIKYPHIERIALNSPSLCSVVITDIDSSMVGDWAIYGKFRALTNGLNEVRLPLNLFLYNEDNPYEQAYNLTVLNEDRHLINLGATLNVSVSSSGEVDDCRFSMPSGQIFYLSSTKTTEGVVFKSLDTATCQIAIGPITEEMVGEWQIIGKFSNGNQFTERQQTFHIIQEDPENPIIDEDRNIETITDLILDTEMGASHRVTINSASFVENESCHLLTPNGLQYAFILGFNVSNVEIIEATGVECGIIVNVLTLDMLGEWTLIARATRLSVPIERRLSFTIRVEETYALGNAINITEGADLYVRLPNATYLYDTCKLYGPDGEEITNFAVDPSHPYSCGYIVRSINRNQHGIWTIVYGNQITFRATVEVNVLGSPDISMENLVWTIGRSVNISVGPEDALYCKVEDANGFTVFEGFGSCNIMLDRVTIDHRGVWKVFVGVPGAVLLQEHGFYVEVQAADPNPVVTTSVVRNAPSVLLTCSVPIEYEVQACKFRDPRGNILVASHGVGQDGYTFDGAIVNYESDAHSHDCTLRLTNPSILDLGLWRCAVDTNEGTFFGFITAVCPWLMQDETAAASVVTEPVLTQDREVVPSLEGDAVVMSCSIDSAIRYCYFRARNGTVFNVAPAISSQGYEYVGSGLDAGDCGIRFSSLLASDAGAWSCHVGLANTTVDEQRASFTVMVREKMPVTHFWQGSSVVVRGSMYDELPLDYCRFVRIDGRGFTSDNVPAGFEVEPTLSSGICTLRISDPNILDVHPWTVVAKITGEDGEITKSTIDTLIIFPPLLGGMPLGRAIFLWIFVTISFLLLVSAAVALIPKKNRNWTYARASHVRNSWRNSLRQRPQPNDILTDLPIKV